jgi:hypothetical protein
VLALRTIPALARRAAEAFSKDNADYLQARGINPTFADLRLAFLLGPADAVRVLQRPAQTPVDEILSRAVMHFRARNAPGPWGVVCAGLVSQ